MAKVLLDPFDKDREFEVARDQILWRGTTLHRGDRFPKETASKRSLRLLYETRALVYGATASSKAPKPPREPKGVDRGPDPQEEKLELVQKNSATQLRKIADGLGISYEPRANKAQLADLIVEARRVAATG